MTQERLMERLWLLLQPYGWELRKNHLYNVVPTYNTIDEYENRIKIRESWYTHLRLYFDNSRYQFTLAIACNENKDDEPRDGWRYVLINVEEAKTLREMLWHIWCYIETNVNIRFLEEYQPMRIVFERAFGNDEDVLDFDLFQEENGHLTL